MGVDDGGEQPGRLLQRLLQAGVWVSKNQKDKYIKQIFIKDSYLLGRVNSPHASVGKPGSKLPEPGVAQLTLQAGGEAVPVIQLGGRAGPSTSYWARRGHTAN